MTSVLEVWVLVELLTTGERRLKLSFGFLCGSVWVAVYKVKLVVAC